MATYDIPDDISKVQKAMSGKPEDYIFNGNIMRFSTTEMAEQAAVHGDEITSLEVTMGKEEEEVTKLCEEEKRLLICIEEYHRKVKEDHDVLWRNRKRVSKELEELRKEEEKLSQRRKELQEKESELFDKMSLNEDKFVKWKFDIEEQIRGLREMKLHKQDTISRMKGTISKSQTMKIQLEKQAAERKAAEEEVEREEARKRAEREEAERLRVVAEAKAERLKKVAAEMEARKKEQQEKKRIEDLKEEQEKAIAEARESVAKVTTLPPPLLPDNSDDLMEIEREEIIEQGVAPPNMDLCVLDVFMKLYRQLSPEARLKVIMS